MIEQAEIHRLSESSQIENRFDFSNVCTVEQKVKERDQDEQQFGYSSKKQLEKAVS